MCYNCGCHNPSDDMGNQNNITTETVKRLASEWKVSDKEAKHRIFKYVTGAIQDPQLDQVFTQASKAWGQSIEDAKKQAYKVLKEELE